MGARPGVALVGDAGYCGSPVSGAGAELSLVGAYLLAAELAAAHGDHRRAFAEYDRALRPLVDHKQRVGPNLRLLVPRTRLGLAARNTITRLPLLESLAGLERIMAPTKTITLPAPPAPAATGPSAPPGEANARR